MSDCIQAFDFTTIINELDNHCIQTYQTLGRLVNPLLDNTDDKPPVVHPILILKYSDRRPDYGFVYYLTNGDIGVLFHSGNSILRLPGLDRFVELTHHNDGKWTLTSCPLLRPLKEVKQQLHLMETFTPSLGDICDAANNAMRSYGTVFLRRYICTPEYTMFEMTNGNYQFSFHDQHTLCLSQCGQAVTHFLPQQVTTTQSLAVVLALKNFPGGGVPNVMVKMRMICDAFKRKTLKLPEYSNC